MRPRGKRHNESIADEKTILVIPDTMRIITNHHLLLVTMVFTWSSEISAMLHPLRFIKSGHVRRGLILKASNDSMDDSMEGRKTLHDLLQEMKSIRQGVTSAIEDIEVMADENPVAILLQEMKSLKKEISSTQLSPVEVSPDALQEMQSLNAQVCSTNIALTGIQDLLRDSVKMRRIEFAIAHHGVQKVLDPCLPDNVLDLRGFIQLDDSDDDDDDDFDDDFDGELCVSTFDFNSFVVSTLYGLLGNKGVRLPDVVYNENLIDLVDGDRIQLLEDEDARRYGIEQFHKATVSHIHLLLGSKPRIERNGEKSFLFYDWN